MKDGQIAVALTNGVAVLSPDGKILRQVNVRASEIIGIAIAGDDLVLAASDTLLVVDGKTFDKKASIPLGGRIYQIASNADGSRVAVARYGKTGVFINMADQAPKEFPLSACPRGAAWLPDGNRMAFSTDADVEVFDADGTMKENLSYFGAGRGMNSPKLSTSTDGKWLIAADEAGAMEFWPTNLSTKSPAATYSKGGPWFSAFYASSPTKPYAGHPVGELSDTEVAVLNPIPYPASEVTGITGRPDGTVVFSTWRGDVVCWDLSKVPASNELAKPITEAETRGTGISLRLGQGHAFFSPIVKQTEDHIGNQIVLRFEWKGKALADYAIPGTCAGSSPLTAVTSFDGHAAVVSTGTSPVKALVTMEQLQSTPALARTLDTMAEIQPSVYIVDGKTGAVSPVEETRGISAYYLSLNGDIASISGGAGSEWSGLMTMDIRSKKMLRTGKADIPTDSPPKVFPMAVDRLAVSARDSHRVQWMTHKQKEIPKSEGPAYRTKLPFKPNGVWSTIATTNVDYDVWTAAASPDGKYLAVLTERDTIDLLAWGEPKPKGCFPAKGASHTIRALYWQDKDTLVCENGASTVTYHVSSDLLCPVAFTQTGGFLGVTPDGKPCFVQAPQENESLQADGYNDIVTKKERHRVAWLPSISPGVWCEVPGCNLAAYSSDGLWVSDAATGNIVRGYNAPRAEGMAATKGKVFTRGGDGSVFEWVLPPR